jgi:hypothetical protein
MTAHKASGRGKLSANLTRIPAAAVTQPPTSGAKKGLEIVREKFQAHADLKPTPRVVVWDHDANRVLFSGTPFEYARLKSALAQGEGE